MSKVLVDKYKIDNIANAIRDKTKKIDDMSINEMASEIYDITTTLPYVQLTFPETTYGDTIYYTNENGEFISLQTGIWAERSINVMKNTLVCSSEPTAFDNMNVYTYDENLVTRILINKGYYGASSYAIVANRNIEFGYSDSGPV